MYYLNNFFISSKNSLKKQTEAEIQKQQPMLFPTMKEWIYNSITLENTIGWIVIGLFICILLSIAGSYFGFIPVDINSAKSIIDQRIGNLATIIGTSLTVATLLINNVANKKKEYYEIMFKKTYLRGTVVTTLIIFAFLLTISFLKDFLSTEYPDLFCNLYGLSYFLIFVVLFLIGKLFYNLIHVFDPMFLQIGIKDELQKATKKTIYNVLYNDKSTKIYKEKILKPLGIEKITRYMIISGEDKKTTILLHDFPYVINDVRIHDLSNLIKKNKENLIESDYQVIGDAFEDLKNKKEILLTDNFLTFKDKLVKCFKIKKAKNETLNLDNLYKIIQSDLHKIIKLKEKDFNETDLESTLSNYKIIYETYYDYLSNSENHEIYLELELIRYLHYDFQFAIEEALNNDNKNLLGRILDFNSSQCHDSVRYNSIHTFSAYLHIENRIISSAKNSSRNHTNFIINKKINRIQLDIWIIERLHQSVNSTKAKPFIEQIFYHWAQFLYDLLENKNFDGFERAVKCFDKEFSIYTANHNWDIYDLLERIKNKEAEFINIETFNQENYFPYLFLCTNITIFSWICNKLSYSNDEKEIEALIKSINLFHNLTSEPENILIAVDYVYNTRRNHNGNWSFITDWGYTPDPDTNFSIRGFSTDWLLLGLAVYCLKNRLNFNQSIEIFPIDTRILYWQSSIKEQLNLIKNDFERWSSIINIKSEEDFEFINDDFLEFFRLLRFRNDRKIEKDISEQRISVDVEENLKSEILIGWNKKTELLHLFDIFNNIHINNIEDATNSFGLNQLLHKDILKSENQNSVGTNFGSQLGYGLNKKIIETILTTEVEHEANLIIEAIQKGIELLNTDGIKSDLIIIGYNLIYNKTKFEDGKYLRDYLDEENRNAENREYLGKIKDILVYRSNLHDLRNKVLVCNFTQAFELELTENDEWLGQQLYFSLEEIDDKKAMQILKDNPSWKIGNDKTELSDELALIKIKNNLHFKLSFNVKLNILDKEAYKIINII